MKYAAIQAHRGRYALTLMCRALGVSRRGFYAWETREPSEKARQDERLLMRVRAAFRHSHKTYGSPRVHRTRRLQEVRCGRKRVERLMREDGLVARRRRRYRRTTDSTHALPVPGNLVARQFDVAHVDGPDRVWVSDLTYVPTREGWLYLATVLDLGTRRVVGWSMRDTLEAELALDALQMALARRYPAPGLVHHSDRGVQYASTAYRELLEAHGAVASMSRKGNCWDNAVAEAFFSTLEFELIEGANWGTHAEARKAIFRYIEGWYNRERLHSSLGYLSPVAYEEQLALMRRAA